MAVKVLWRDEELLIPQSLPEASDVLRKLLQEGKQVHVVTLNAEMVALALEDDLLFKAITSAQLIIPDSHGVCFLLRNVTRRGIERVPGIEFAEELLRSYGKRGVYLLGAREEVVKRLPEILRDMFSAEVVGYRNGYFSEEENPEIIEDINSKRPFLLLVAMGVPKQELWIRENLPKLPSVKVAIGLGGSFDVWAGEVRRAPLILRKMGLEWLYRMISDPRRFKRFPRLIKFSLIATRGLFRMKEERGG